MAYLKEPVNLGIVMLKRTKKIGSKDFRTGQSMVEYVLVFVAVIVVLITALGPGGFLASQVDQSISEAVSGIDCMAQSVCYGSAGCDSMCGNSTVAGP
jgi:hypothetical protein